MNYYNPYYMYYPAFSMPKPTLFGALRNSISGINFNSILNGTQRTLNIINQAIPLVRQVSPVMKNAKTMFRVMNEFKKINPIKKTTNYSNDYSNNYSESVSSAGPKFFI